MHMPEPWQTGLPEVTRGKLFKLSVDLVLRFSGK